MKYGLQIDWSGTGLWIGVFVAEPGLEWDRGLIKLYAHSDLPQTPGEWFEQFIEDDHQRSIEAERREQNHR